MTEQERIAKIEQSIADLESGLSELKHELSELKQTQAVSATVSCTDSTETGTEAVPAAPVNEAHHFSSAPDVQAPKIPEQNKVTKKKSSGFEDNLGGKVMGIVAAVLVFIGLFLFGSLLYERLGDPARIASLFLISFFLLGAGLFLERKRISWFTASLVGCGFGAVYISLFITSLYFHLFSAEVLYLLLLFWLTGVGLYVFRRRSYIGTPKDIYNEPENAFVADFIGESNILDGVMLEDYLAEFSGHKFKCLDKGFAKGESVDVVVRPEDVDIVAPDKGMLTGVVTSVTFLGVHYEIIVDIGGFKWMIQTTDEAFEGDTVGLFIEPDAIHIMKKSIYSGKFGDYSSYSDEIDHLNDPEPAEETENEENFDW